VLAEYVLLDLVRNPRRTLSTMVGVILGVGLFCGVLFFVDGLSASMTQRAVAPLPIDMQRLVTEPIGGAITLVQRFDPPGSVPADGRARVALEIRNTSDVAANEVTVRSLPGDALHFVAGSAEVGGQAVTGFDDNPFAHGPGSVGLNIGTVGSGATVPVTYIDEGTAGVELTDAMVQTSFSSRESVSPVPANQASTVPLNDLAAQISQVSGVAHAAQLSLADLGSDTLSSGGRPVRGPVKIFGFDARYAERDSTIELVSGAVERDQAVISAEAAQAMEAGIGDTVTVTLPDATRIDVVVGGVADLSRARSLFASRRGSDLEAFVYSRNSIIVPPEVFAGTIMPAYERAATTRGERLKNPPVREVDITVERGLLDSDPGTAAAQTGRIAADVSAVATQQDFLLDNISNTLTVAAADARVAKQLFVFLGVPGGLLAAMLAAYAGTVLADAQRREQATLRIRGASRRHLLHMLTLRTAAMTASGSLIGLGLGYGVAIVILGPESMLRASSASIATSALLSSVGGFLATGLALYLTGRRSIDREINDDRARLARRVPLWRRAGLDIVGLAAAIAGTLIAVALNAFDGAAGSVYFGRAVQLNVGLLVLPVAVWVTGALLAARLIGAGLSGSKPQSTGTIGSPLVSLYRLSIGRRPWAIGNGVVVVSLIVALATCLAAFTSSYDAAKSRDARYATGSDIRVTPGPTAQRRYEAGDAAIFRTDGVTGASPVIYGIRNVILRSARTSDPANLAAVDPATYATIAPVRDGDFASGDALAAMHTLRDDPTTVMVSTQMAVFLKAHPGDTLHVLLARGTGEQIEADFRIAGLFERLPGFPDGADALMSIDGYAAHVPSKTPDFFLAATDSPDDAGLRRAMSSLEAGPAAADHLQIETRSSTLARDQSSLAALNIAGLVALDSTFALGMAAVAIAIFVFGLLLQRRREYVTLRAQGLEPHTIRRLIAAEASTVAIGGTVAGVLVGAAMGYYFVAVLRPLFVLVPAYHLPARGVVEPVGLVILATVIVTWFASRLVNRLDPTELLRDE